MENNQHSNSGNGATDNQETTSFSNSQPGQQLPTGNNKSDLDRASASGEEQHSESSRPEEENETLGTP